MGDGRLLAKIEWIFDKIDRVVTCIVLPCELCFQAIDKNFGRAAMIVRDRSISSNITRFIGNFVGACVLTWASMVVLGGFVSALDEQEFMRVSLLLLLQAIQFVYTTQWIVIFTRLSDRLLFADRLQFGYKLGHGIFSLWTYPTANFCIFFSFGISIRDLTSFKVSHNFLVYDTALRFFYVLVLINASITSIGMWQSLQKFFMGRQSIFLLCYSNRVMQIAQDRGHKVARQVELIDLVFEMMADECRDVTGKGLLYSLCHQVVPYVYKHKRGFEATLAAMESNDRHVQEAAILMVGFWVQYLESRTKAEKKLLCFQEALLRRLVVLAVGSTVEGPRKNAAMWSLQMLAKHDPRALIRPVQGESSMFLEDLAQHISMLIDLGGHESHDAHGLVPLMNVVYAVLQDEHSRACFTVDQISLLSDKLKIVHTSSLSRDSDSNNCKRVADVALLTLNSMQAADGDQQLHQNALTASPHPHEDALEYNELTDPQFALQRTKSWVLVLLYCASGGMFVAYYYLIEYLYKKLSNPAS